MKAMQRTYQSWNRLPQQGEWPLIPPFNVDHTVLGSKWAHALGILGMVVMLNSGARAEIEMQTAVITQTWPGGQIVTVQVSKTSGHTNYSWPAVSESTLPSNTPSVQVPYEFRISRPTPPLGMVFVPAHIFNMGRGTLMQPDSAPIHTTKVNAIFVDKWEVTKAMWDDVRIWSLTHDYRGITEGRVGYSAAGLSTSNHPVTDISWFDCIKWCNARSEKEGLIPAYYANLQLTQVIRSNTYFNLDNALVDWYANGYRLPTEAEWEQAARGGFSDKNYPWGDIIEKTQANFMESGDPFEPGTTPVGYYNGSQKIDGSQLGGGMVNGYGLYDVIGNVMEWCWDWYGPYGPATQDNPRGPDKGRFRILRGGSWKTFSEAALMTSYRHYSEPWIKKNTFGLRCVRTFR